MSKINSYLNNNDDDDEIIELTDIVEKKGPFINFEKKCDNTEENEKYEDDETEKTYKLKEYYEAEKNTNHIIDEERIEKIDKKEIEAIVKKVVAEMCESKINAIFEKTVEQTVTQEIKRLKAVLAS